MATDERPICGARTRSTGAPCRNRILGPNGRCKSHGGHLKPAPRGNRRALKTGSDVRIGLDTLSAQELAWYVGTAVDELIQLDHMIRIERIREAQIRGRIAEAQHLSSIPWETVEIREESEKFGVRRVLESRGISPQKFILDATEALTRVMTGLGKLIASRAAIMEKRAGQATATDDTAVALILVDDDREDWAALAISAEAGE